MPVAPQRPCPQRVHSDLLQRPTLEQAEQLETIEREIIVIPDQKIELDDRRLKARIAMAAAMKKLTTAQEEQKALKTELAEAEKAKDEPLAEQLKAKLADKDQEVTKRQQAQDYVAAHRKTLAVEQKMLDAKLAVKVAAQMLQEAKIGAAYQATDEGKLVEGHEPINVSVYEAHLKASKTALIQANKDFEAQLNKFEALPEPANAP